MIGPSAPNGPPVPIATAAESGLRNMTAAGYGSRAQHLLHRFWDAMPPDRF